MKRVAINGFGRIGRSYLRSALFSDEIDVVHINDLQSIESSSYLFKNDSIYGKYTEDVSINNENIEIGKNVISYSSIKNPIELPWRLMNIDVVIESTGIFSSFKKAHNHIVAGAKKVIITSPVEDNDIENLETDTILIGVNSERAKKCVITSNASCTTNAVGIPLDVMNKTIGVESAVLNTIHSYTQTQQLLDSMSKKKSDLRYGRSSTLNIIPSTTGAANTTTKVVKELSGLFDGVALRIPIAIGSIVDLTFVTKRKTTIQEVNDLLFGIKNKLFTTTRDPVVSSDIIGEKYVAIVDLTLTKVVNGNLVKLLIWYDNETGYAESLIEHTKLL